jgi:flagellar hook-length control protein FliK
MQMVAATISKAAASGETKSIMLQLDPPELGRVEVRLNFGKDKTVKAVLTAEKPETLNMLQRDAHSLERILTDSGFNVDGGGIDFSLAGEGQNFNQQNQDGSSGYASKDDGLQEIIESQMTWSVDPETGHMHYNILV